MVSATPNLSLAATKPAPLIICSWPADWRALDTVCGYVAIKYALAHGYPPGVDFRCCAWNRLETVLASGVDKPKEAVLWTDSSPEKALEYGGINPDRKIMLAYLSDRLERTYRRARADITPEERARLAAEYPTLIELPNNRYPLWFSKLPDRLAALPYESAHARLISGDPFQALLMVIALGRDHQAVRTDVREAIQRCRSPIWTLGDPKDEEVLLQLFSEIPSLER